jgi:hypothetical protein
MATGTILTLDPPPLNGVPTSGTLQNDDPAYPNPLPFTDNSLVWARILLTVNERVSFNIDVNGVISTVRPLVVADPDFPADAGTVYTTPYNGHLVIAAGTTVTVSGTTVNGNVHVNGGTLILKSSTSAGTTRSSVTGQINASALANVVIYKSDVIGNLLFHESQDLTIKGGSVGGDTDIHSSRTVKNQGSVGGDTDIKNCANLLLTGLTINGASNGLKVRDMETTTAISNVIVSNGDALIKNNTGCSYSNITAPNGTVNITGCNPA